MTILVIPAGHRVQLDLVGICGGTSPGRPAPLRAFRGLLVRPGAAGLPVLLERDGLDARPHPGCAYQVLKVFDLVVVEASQAAFVRGGHGLARQGHGLHSLNSGLERHLCSCNTTSRSCWLRWAWGRTAPPP